jgi:hypothetical protein
MMFMKKIVTTTKATSTDSRYVLILWTKHIKIVARMLESLVGRVPIPWHLSNVHRRLAEYAPRYWRTGSSGDLGHVVCPLSRARYAISIVSVETRWLVLYKQFPEHCAVDLHGVTGRQKCNTSALTTSGHGLRPTIRLSDIRDSHFQAPKIKNA